MDEAKQMTVEEALDAADQIVGFYDGDPYDLIERGCDTLEVLAAEVRRLTAALATARREGAEAMRAALVDRFEERVKYLHPWAEAEDDENGCHSGAWTEALNAVQFTRDMVLPLDAPGGAT